MSEDKDKMEFMTTIRMTKDLHTRLKQKAGMVPIAAIIRRLIELYVEDKIELDRV